MFVCLGFCLGGFVCFGFVVLLGGRVIVVVLFVGVFSFCLLY